MTTPSPLPAGFSWMSPYIIVKDVDIATDFYIKAFGFTLKEKISTQNDGVNTHAEMFYKNQSVMFGREGEYGGKKSAKSPASSNIESPMSLYLYCEDVDKFHHHAVECGAKSLDAPVDMFWGDRMCRLQCPDGYIWAFATHLGIPCEDLKKKNK